MAMQQISECTQRFCKDYDITEKTNDAGKMIRTKEKKGEKNISYGSAACSFHMKGK